MSVVQEKKGHDEYRRGDMAETLEAIFGMLLFLAICMTLLILTYQTTGRYINLWKERKLVRDAIELFIRAVATPTPS